MKPIIPIMRTALEQIQELHRSVPIYTTEVGDCEHDGCEGIEIDGDTYCRYATDGVTCSECAEIVQQYCVDDGLPSWPCATRKLADEGLTDRMARTNQGDNNGRK